MAVFALAKQNAGEKRAERRRQTNRRGDRGGSDGEEHRDGDDRLATAGAAGEPHQRADHEAPRNDDDGDRSDSETDRPQHRT